MLRPFIARYRYIKKQFDNLFTGNTQWESGSKRHTRNEEKPVSKKKIDKDVGEYVSFEEISVTASTYTETTADTTVEKTIIEQQTVDIEWEDV